MGRVVTFAQLPANKTTGGTESASITKGETREMAAEYIRIPPGQRWTATAPRGSDCYLFMLDGAGAILAAGGRHHFPAHAFAVVQEGIEFTVESDRGKPASIIKVVAPPQPNNRSAAGFTGRSRSPNAKRRRCSICRTRKRSASISSMTPR